MKLKTTEFVALLSKSVRASSNNRLIPITSLIKIEVKQGTLTLETTDSVNYLYVSQQINDDDFYAVVDVSTLYSLITKLTCETINMSNVDNVLVISCGTKSTYKIPMQLDEDGNVIKYPSPLEKYATAEDGIKVTSEMFSRVIDTCRTSLSPVISDMGINQYFFKDSQAITTDSIRVSCLNDVSISPFSAYVLNPTFVSLLANSFEDDLDLQITSEYAIAKSPTYVVVCNNLSDPEKYPNVVPFLSDKMLYEGHCVIDKSNMVEVLERIALFTTSLTKNVVHLSFTDTCIEFSTPNTSGRDYVTYTDIGTYTAYECDVAITLLLDALKAFNKNKLDLYYNNSTLIRLSCDDSTQLMCLTSN